MWLEVLIKNDMMRVCAKNICAIIEWLMTDSGWIFLNVRDRQGTRANVILRPQHVHSIGSRVTVNRFGLLNCCNVRISSRFLKGNDPVKLRLKYDTLFVRTVGNSTLFLDHHCFTNGLLYYLRSINLNWNNLPIQYEEESQEIWYLWHQNLRWSASLKDEQVKWNTMIS